MTLPLTPNPTLVSDWAMALLNCLTATLAAPPFERPVAHAALRWTPDLPPADLCACVNEQGEGVAWVTLRDQTEQDTDDNPAGCFPTKWITSLRMGIYRCYPGDPEPTDFVDITNATLDMYKDMEALIYALASCGLTYNGIPVKFEVDPEGVVPYAPLGACAGAIMTLNIERDYL